MTSARRSAPLVAFATLAAAWLTLNQLGWAAAARTSAAANELMRAATGHVAWAYGPGGAPSISLEIVQALLPAAAAALLGVHLRRTRRGPWFLAVGAIPILVSGASTGHGWWRPGPGIDAYASGAGFGSRDLDLTSYGAGPAWVVWAGTALTLAVALVPALLTRHEGTVTGVRAAMTRTAPYAVIAGLAVGATVGLLGVTQSGGDTVFLMAAGAAGAVGAILAAAVLAPAGATTDMLLIGVAFAAVAAAAINPGAMLSTHLLLAGLAGLSVGVAAIAIRRPQLRHPRHAALVEAV